MTVPEKKKAELKVTGMTCATCAATIEESLSKMKDVSKVSVNFGTDTAHVEYDPEKVSLPDLEKTIKDAGYSVVNREVTIKVGGMMCATCVATIEAALRELPGVVSVMVNLGTGGGWPVDLSSYDGAIDMYVDYVRVYGRK